MRPFFLFITFLGIIYAETLQHKFITFTKDTNTTFTTNILDCFDGNGKACLKAGEYYSAHAYKQCDKTPEQIAANTATLYKKACDLGSAKGCTAYGAIYTSDPHKDASRNPRYYFQKGCDGGDTAACTLLKMMPEGI